MMDIFSCSVACGMGHSMVVVDRTNVGDRLDQVIIQKQQSHPLIGKVLFYLWCCILFCMLTVMPVHSSIVQPH